MTAITMHITGPVPADEPDPDSWTRGYVAGVLRESGCVVDLGEPQDLTGLDLGPGIRDALADATALSHQMDQTCPYAGCEATFTNGGGRAAHLAAHDAAGRDTECEWCGRSFRPTGIRIHQARCPSRPADGGPVTAVPEIVGADDRQTRHDRRRAAAADNI